MRCNKEEKELCFLGIESLEAWSQILSPPPFLTYRYFLLKDWLGRIYCNIRRGKVDKFFSKLTFRVLFGSALWRCGGSGFCDQATVWRCLCVQGRQKTVYLQHRTSTHPTMANDVCVSVFKSCKGVGGKTKGRREVGKSSCRCCKDVLWSH